MRYMSPMLIPLIVLFALAIAFSSAAAQTGYIDETEIGQPIFATDFATFRSDSAEDLVRLEVYYKVYNIGLKFIKSQNEFVADYEIGIVVLGKDGQVAGTSRDRIYRVGSYDETQDARNYLVNQIDLNIPKGKYKLVCHLTDNNSKQESQTEDEVEVKNLYRNSLDMSDVEYVYDIREGTDTPSGFDKGERQVIPAVTRSFTGEGTRWSFYVELYNNSGESKDVIVKYKVRGQRMKKSYDDETELTLDKPITRLIKEIPTGEFLPDEYQLMFELKEKRRKKWAERKSDFVVEWSLDALVKNDFDAAVDQLRYIANPAETKELRKHAGDDFADRKKAFDDFWRAHDKYPETPENETKALYYERVRHANKYFSVVHQQGWETDRGRIYIIFGEPDNVERLPFELDRVPQQIWYYYRYSRTFVFEDKHQTGDYYLTYPYDGRDGGLHEGFEDFN